MLSTISCTHWILFPSLEKCICKSSPFFKLNYYWFFAIEFMSFLYILDINTLSDTWFANIFSHSKRIDTCIRILNHFAVHLKLTQHCKATILQFRKKERGWRLTVNEYKESYLGDRNAPKLINGDGCTTY